MEKRPEFEPDYIFEGVDMSLKLVVIIVLLITLLS